MPLVLVIGMLDTDSGKTVMAYSIARLLASEGFRVAPIKPLGATDLWRSPWVLREIEERGLVVLGDAVVLSQAVGDSLEIEEINPLALVLAPPDPERLGWSWTPYSGLLGDSVRRAVLARLTACTGSDRATLHVVNVKALGRAPGGLSSRLTDIIERLRPEPQRGDDSSISRILSSLAAIESCVLRALSSSEVGVMESYSDIAVPIPFALNSDLVVTVTPGKAGIIPGDRYRSAVQVLSSMSTSTTLTTREIVSLTGIQESIELPLMEYPLSTGYPKEALEPILERVKELARR